MNWAWWLVGAYVIINPVLIVSAWRSRRAFAAACERWDDVAHEGTHARGTVVRGIGLGVLHPRVYQIEFRDIEGATHRVRQAVSGPWLSSGAHIEVRYPVDLTALASVDPRRSHPTWRFTVLWLAVYPVLALASGVALVLALQG